MIHITTDFKDNPKLFGRISYAFEVLFSGRLDNEPAGRVDLSDGVYCLVEEYDTKDLPETVEYEVHEKYVDVQYVASGVECMKLCPLSEIEITKPYNPEKDKTMGVLKDASKNEDIVLRAGEGFVLMPDEAHMPQFDCGGKHRVRKYVFKVPVKD